MKVGIAILTAVILIELIAVGVYLQQQASTTIPLLPEQHLADSSIEPQLKALAEAAQGGDADDWNRLGEGLLGKGFYAHAELAFRQSLQKDPDHFASLFGLAFCLDRTGRMQESNVAYGNVVQTGAQSPEQQAMQIYALYGMGRNALRLEDAETASELFRQNADYPAAEYQQAKLGIRAGDAQQALPLIQKNLTNIPYSLGFHFLDQRAQEALGNERAAFLAKAMVERSAYLVSLNFSTDYVAPLNEQTGVDALVPELMEALEEEDWSGVEATCHAIEQATQDSPVFAAKPVADARIQLLLHKQQPQEVLELIAKLESEGRVDALTLEAAGDAYRQLQNPVQAIQHWQRALRLKPSIPLHEKLADHLAEEQNFHRSQVALMQGLEHYRSNRLRSAIPEFQRAIELDPKLADAWYYLGEMYFHLDQPKEAVEAYRQCQLVDPLHGRAADKIAFLETENPS
ncbi:tetratricopeptide repeat protein [Bremerella sp. JC770]|uniref:tetratricopeptide repeat protein n=1 Tax=Bremerella sp. JC770 TaxID=3232137 RepID=UPI003458FA40